MAMDEDRTRKKKEEDEEEEEEEQTNTKGKGIIEKKKGIVIQNYENSPFLLLLCYFLKFPKYPCHSHTNVLSLFLSRVVVGFGNYQLTWLGFLFLMSWSTYGACIRSSPWAPAPP